MIIDNIKNYKLYTALHSDFEAVFEGLAKLDGDCGRTEINGDAAHFSASTYTTKKLADCKYEAHKKYIDIQFVIKGEEDIRLCDARTLTPCEDFKDGGDIAFYAASEHFSEAHLSAGEFAIIFPYEAHMPCLAKDDEPASVTKAVAKILAK